MSNNTDYSEQYNAESITAQRPQNFHRIFNQRPDPRLFVPYSASTPRNNPDTVRSNAAGSIPEERRVRR